MIVDASALLAIIRREPHLRACFQALFDSPVNRLSAANFLEVCLVVDGPQDPTASREFDELIDQFSIVVEPVTVAQVHIARRAHQSAMAEDVDILRGSTLASFGYALAVDLDEPLLFIGQDFVHTDIQPTLT